MTYDTDIHVRSYVLTYDIIRACRYYTILYGVRPTYISKSYAYVRYATSARIQIHTNTCKICKIWALHYSAYLFLMFYFILYVGVSLLKCYRPAAEPKELRSSKDIQKQVFLHAEIRVGRRNDPFKLVLTTTRRQRIQLLSD
jgi:hypothetical protein